MIGEAAEGIFRVQRLMGVTHTGIDVSNQYAFPTHIECGLAVVAIGKIYATAEQIRQQNGDLR